MNDEEMLAETRAFNDGIEALLATLPPVFTQPPDVTRRERREGGGVFPAPVFEPLARWEHIAGRGGDIPLRIIEPEGEPQGVYLHFHGGGWVLGAADLQDPGLKAAADATGFTMVSVGYRLAPEHPYPAAPDDCEDAALWLLERFSGPRFSGRRVTGGESAGAQLAAVTLLRLRDRHGVDVREAFAGANLVFGPFDLTGTPSRHLWGDRELILSSPEMDWFADCYLPDMPDRERRAPDVSPLYADLAGLPPALFTCGTFDPLLDDTLFMESRWRTAGNATTLTLYPEAPHAFVAFEIDAARRSRAEQYAFLRG
jgi:acetyl esterase